MKSLDTMNMKERYLAIVLLDIIGSTLFVQKAGRLKSAKWFQYHDRLTRSLIYKFNGREIDRSDGFMLSFETVMDAVNFGLVYQETIPKKTHLGCRIGIHWGIVVEVKQESYFVEANAKSVELEGVAKNIAARTMSLCGRGQVLLTKAAFAHVKQDKYTPKGTNFACVGLYEFKGVRQPVEIYALGTSMESLQPPKGSDKVKRLGGPKYIKKKKRNYVLRDWGEWFFWRIGILFLFGWIYAFWPIVFSKYGRSIFYRDLHYVYVVYDFFNSLF